MIFAVDKVGRMCSHLYMRCSNDKRKHKHVLAAHMYHFSGLQSVQKCFVKFHGWNQFCFIVPCLVGPKSVFNIYKNK